MKKKPSSDALDRALAALYQADVPAGYRASWRDAVKREEPSDMKSTPRLKWMKRAALPVAAAVVLILGTAITGVIAPQTQAPEPSAQPYAETETAPALKGSGATVDFDYAVNEDLAFAAAPSLASTASRTMDEAEGQSAAADDRKIIRTVSLTIASTLFDTDYAAILSLAEGAGGYASSVSVYEQQADQRVASLELRIPADALDGFLGGLDGIGRTTDRYETADDMTTQYSDTQLRLKTQQDKMARLGELLLQAESVEDLLNIESEIADTQYMIDSLQSSLLSIDRQVDYADVSVYLREQTASDTAAAQDLTIGERLISGIRASLKWLGGFFENMLVFLVAAAPVLVPLIVLVIVYRVVRKRRKSNKQS